MGGQRGYPEHSKKHGGGREVNTALYLLRAIELGLSAADLELITVGMVYDMLTEKSYDETGYVREATQKDFDGF